MPHPASSGGADEAGDELAGGGGGCCPYGVPQAVQSKRGLSAAGPASGARRDLSSMLADSMKALPALLWASYVSARASKAATMSRSALASRSPTACAAASADDATVREGEREAPRDGEAAFPRPFGQPILRSAQAAQSNPPPQHAIIQFRRYAAQDCAQRSSTQ